MRYLLPMRYGSWALIVVLVMTAALLLMELGRKNFGDLENRP